jgi:hypothetical protein
VPVAQICNPSYLGGRDQEDLGWRPASANSSPAQIVQETCLENIQYEKGKVEWLKRLPSKCGALSSNPCTTKKTSICWAPVTHAYNPSYIGGRDQENSGSKSSPSEKPWVQTPVLSKKKKKSL